MLVLLYVLVMLAVAGELLRLLFSYPFVVAVVVVVKMSSEKTKSLELAVGEGGLPYG